MSRTARVERTTSETKLVVEVDLELVLHRVRFHAPILGLPERPEPALR